MALFGPTVTKNGVDMHALSHCLHARFLAVTTLISTKYVFIKPHRLRNLYRIRCMAPQHTV